MALVFFDLDGTLLAGDCEDEWGRFLCAQGVLDYAQYEAQLQTFIAQYRAGTVDLHEYLAFQLQPLTRYPRAVLDAWQRQFMQHRVRPLLRESARALVHRHNSDVRVVITASTQFVAAPIAQAFGIPHLIATELEERDGAFTGNVQGEPCFGAGKVRKLDRWLARQGMSLTRLRETWFYTDSLNDLPLLQRVTHPVAVDPDDALHAHAQQAGWPILRL